jgi:hypothetical protein
MRAFIAGAMLIAAPLAAQSSADPNPVLVAALKFAVDSMPEHIAAAATDSAACIVLLSDRVRISAAGQFQVVDPEPVARAAGIDRLAPYSQIIVCDAADITMDRCRIQGASVGLTASLIRVVGNEAHASVAYHYRLPNGSAGFRSDTFLLVRDGNRWRVHEIIETIVS